jgi:hypothetical protein
MLRASFHGTQQGISKLTGAGLAEQLCEPVRPVFFTVAPQRQK